MKLIKHFNAKANTQTDTDKLIGTVFQDVRPLHEPDHYKQHVKTAALTLFPSSQRVTMTIIEDCCSQIILQKSLTVSSFGPSPHIQYIYTGMNSYYEHKIMQVL